MNRALARPCDDDLGRADDRFGPEGPGPIKVAVFTRGLTAAMLTLAIGLIIIFERWTNPDRSGSPTRSVVSDRDGIITSLAFSPDGRNLAVARAAGCVSLWDVASRRKRFDFRRVQGADCLAFSPDGRMLAVANRGPAIRIWDVETGKPRPPMEAPEGHFGSMAFSPDGLTLAASGLDGRVTLWDVASRAIRTTLWGKGNTGRTLAFSPDGRTLAVSRKEGTIDLWDVPNSQVRATLEGHTSTLTNFEGTVVATAFSPDGKTLATAGAFDPSLKIWDTAEARLQTTLDAKVHSITFIAFMPEGRTVLWADRNGGLRSWNLETKQGDVMIDELDQRHLRVAVAPDGKTLAIGEAELLTLWERPASGKSRQQDSMFEPALRQPADVHAPSRSASDHHHEA